MNTFDTSGINRTSHYPFWGYGKLQLARPWSGENPRSPRPCSRSCRQGPEQSQLPSAPLLYPSPVLWPPAQLWRRVGRASLPSPLWPGTWGKSCFLVSRKGKKKQALWNFTRIKWCRLGATEQSGKTGQRDPSVEGRFSLLSPVFCQRAGNSRWQELMRQGGSWGVQKSSWYSLLSPPRSWKAVGKQ